MLSSTHRDRIETRDRYPSVELEQVLEDQPAPAISPRLDEQSAFRKPAELDRRETELFRKRSDLVRSTVVVARKEHGSPAAVGGRILFELGSDEVVETLDKACACEGLRDDLGGRLFSQLLDGHAVGVGHIDDGLSLPGGQRLRDIRVRLETDSQKDESALTASASVLGMTLGPIAAASAAKLVGSRVVATDTSMPLRANALAMAWPILPKPRLRSS